MSKSPSSRSEQAVYPFAAIVGQEQMKLALLLNAVNPAIGGVLIRGEKGTAKSTAVRSLSRVLPLIEAADCAYGCDPQSTNKCDDCRESAESGQARSTTKRRVRVVNLPASATEDRVVGTLDLEAALREGKRRFEPGLLAQAHRGVLYVDEVNLLDDFLVDALLDAAAMGVNRIEREGVSFQHPAEFILVGTMNPEEGELRPQLLDRFGLAVEIQASRDPEDRVRIMERRMAYEASPAAFCREWEPDSGGLEARIESARTLLPSVALPGEMLRLISRIALDMQVDGHRADLVMCKTATTLAALDGRKAATLQDVKTAATLALPHRRRRPSDPAGPGGDGLQRFFDGLNSGPQDGGAAPRRADPDQARAMDGDRPAAQMIEPPDAEFAVPPITAPIRCPVQARAEGRRTPGESPRRRGRWTRTRPMRPGDPLDIALKDTLLNAAIRRRAILPVTAADLMVKRRVRKLSNLFLFVVDSSGSMGVQRRMRAAKAAVLSLLRDARLRRERAALVAFRGAGAEVVVQPTGSLTLARRSMENLPTGGATPLARGLQLARHLLQGLSRKDPDSRPILVLLSDGMANVPLAEGSDPVADAMREADALRRRGVPSLVVDARPKRSALPLAAELAQRMGARYVRLKDLVMGAAGRSIKLVPPGPQPPPV